jgi:multiple sugar transport system substrate-binding protein
MFRSRFPARRLIALVAGLSVALAACTGAASPSPGPTGTPGTSPADVEPTEAAPAGPVTMLSNQLVPVAEQEAMRNEILAGFDGEVEYVGADPGPYTDRVQAEGTTGSGDVSLIGGLHGDFSAFGDRGYLSDLSDVAADLADLGISQDYLDLGKLGTDEQLYIPWMQATYIMVARNEALDYLPDGADINALTWEQLTEWGAAITDDTGDRKLGFPAGEDGLLHRFFQGHSYPAFTGRVNTAFATSDAVDMWNWLKDTWQYVNPQSTTYGFMQEPLQSGEVGRVRLHGVPGSGRTGGPGIHAGHRRPGHPDVGTQPRRSEGTDPLSAPAGHAGHDAARRVVLPGHRRRPAR